MRFLLSSLVQIAASTILLTRPSYAQTWSSCNPLHTTCPANTALGKSISVDFTKGAVDSFTASGNPTYQSDGVHFTVSKSGDSPQLNSRFYIMFGKVSVTMKAAPGVGIVSSLVLQSDDLDEIDFEWLGGDSAQVQLNYFGKGDVTTYNRGTFAAAPNNQAQFITYTVEWTATQIVWSIDNTVVRVLTPATADTNQYPQTPMQVKFGSWSGGDPANSAGTISWAGGLTDYSRGPYSMVVKSISVNDYSTGSSYSYGDQSGSWSSIKSNGGKINGNSAGSAAIAAPNVPSQNSASPSIPAGIGGSSTKTGWPWVASTLSTTTPTYSSIPGVPSGWTVSGEGKIVPASTAATTTSRTLSSSAAPSPSASSLLAHGSGYRWAAALITGSTFAIPTYTPTSSSKPSTTLMTSSKTVSTSVSRIQNPVPTAVAQTSVAAAAASQLSAKSAGVSTKHAVPMGLIAAALAATALF